MCWIQLKRKRGAKREGGEGGRGAVERQKQCAREPKRKKRKPETDIQEPQHIHITIYPPKRPTYPQKSHIHPPKSLDISIEEPYKITDGESERARRRDGEQENDGPRSITAFADLKNSDFSETLWMHSKYRQKRPVCKKKQFRLSQNRHPLCMHAIHVRLFSRGKSVACMSCQKTNKSANIQALCSPQSGRWVDEGGNGRVQRYFLYLYASVWGEGEACMWVHVKDRKDT